MIPVAVGLYLWSEGTVISQCRQCLIHWALIC